MSEQTDSGIREMFIGLLDEAGVERGYVGGERFREHVADYILPKLLPAVRSLRSDSWDEGYQAGLGDMLREHSCVMSMKRHELAATKNPYKEETD